MTEQCQASNEDGRCIFVQGHGGEHFYPNDNQDHSDDIRIRVLRDNVASLEFKLATQAQALKEAEENLRIAKGNALAILDLKAYSEEWSAKYEAECDSLRSQLEAAQTETERLNELATHNTDAYIALESQLETVTNSSLLLTEELRRQITGREEKLGVAMEALKEIPCLWDNPALEACDCVRCAALAKIGGKP